MKRKPSQQIHILTGPIRSGKTTRLLRKFKNTPRIAGILSPDINGSRKLLDLSTGRLFSFQQEVAAVSAPDRLRIGRFTLSLTAFAAARKILTGALEAHPDWIIIDEIGYLELCGLGFQPAVDRIIRAIRERAWKGNLLLVIRDDLLDPAIGLLDLHKPRIIRIKPEQSI